jgi:nicotinamide riboside kinase
MSSFNKIAICGSHSCGKTTLAKALNNHLNYPCIEEVAATYPANTRLNMHTQYDIMSSQILAELSHLDQYGKFLSDRSIIDNLAYSTLVETHRKNTFIHNKCLNMGFYHLRSIPKPYDLLIFVNEILPYEEAPHRNFSTFNDQKFIWKYIADTITIYAQPTSIISINTANDIFNLYNIPVITVCGTTEERVRTILNYINENI